MKRLLVPVLAVPAAFGLALLPTTAAWADEVSLTATASGENETMGGDEDGSAHGTFTLDTASGEICYRVTADALEDVAGMHIHEAPAGKDGDIVVELDPTKVDDGRACTQADRSLVADIVESPEHYYLNLHTATYPEGAVRGQLMAHSPEGSNAGTGGQAGDGLPSPVVPVTLVLVGAGLATAGAYRLAKARG